MSDLSSLQIQISASSTQADNAIDKLIRHLGDLNRALNNYSAGSDYVKGLKNLSGGLAGISSAVESIDLAKIKELSSVLKSLSGAGSKIASLNVAKSITAMSAGAESASKKMRELATSFAGEHGITNPKAISELTEEITKLSQAANDPAASQQSLRNIESIIQSYEEWGNVADEVYEKVRRFVSDSSIYLSKMDVSEYADDFKRMRGVLGINNTTTDPMMGVGLDTWLADFREQFKGVLPELTATQDIMASLVEYLDNGRNAAEEYASQMQSSSEYIEYMNDSLQRLADTLGVVKSEQSDGFFGDDFDLPFGNEFEDVSASAKEAQTSLTGVAQTVSDIKEEFVGNPFEGLVNGLTSLDGISITGEQFGGLKTISESLGKLGGKYAASAAINLPQIADGIQKLASISIPDIGDQLASLAAGVAKFGSKAATRAQNLPQFVEGLRQLATIPAIPKIEGLDSLAQSLSMFGRKTAQQAVTTIPQLATAFRSLIDTMASAPNVSENTIRFAYALAAVTANGSRAGSALKSLTGSTNLFSNSARKASKSTKGLASFFGKLYAKYFLLIRAIRGLGTAIGYSSGLTEVENVVETTFGNSTDKVQEFADEAIMSFGMAELSAKQFASRFQAMGAAMGITTSQVAKASEYLAGVIPQTERVQKLYGDLGDSMADVSVNLTKLTADMASFYNEDYEDVAEDMQAVFTGMTRPLRKYGLDLTQATLKEFALANGLDADISKMTQAQKTMLRYQYVMANMGHVLGDFNKTMNNWANVTRTIGQQFQKLGQIIGEGLINTFKPYLIAFRDFMNTLIGLAEKALNAVGKLLGWEVSLEKVGTTLSEDSEEYADSLGDAADNAKKLNSQLRGIDELNNLTTSKDSGSDGDSSGLGLGASALTDFDGEFKVKKYESDIDSWYEFGEQIAKKIREGLQSIDWDEAYANAKDFGTKFASFLNGGINPQTFSVVGATVAGALNTAIYGALQFSKIFSWDNAGKSLAAGINTFLETFDFKATGEAISSFTSGILNWATAAIEGVEWDLAGQKLVELFMGIDWAKLETDLYELTRAIFNAIVEATKGAVQKAKEDPEAFGELAVSFTRIALFIGALPLGKALFVAAVKKAITGLATGLAGTSTAGTAASVQIPTLMLKFQKLTAAMSTGMKFNEALSYALFGSTAGAGAIGIASGAITLAIIAKVSWDFSNWYSKTKAYKDSEKAVGATKASTFSASQQGANLDMSIMTTLMNAIKKSRQEKSGEAEEVGKQVTAGILKGAVSEAENSSQSKANTVFDLIKKSIMISGGIHSPAKNMYDVGQNIVLGIYEGFGLVDFLGLMNKWWAANVAPWFTKEKWTTITMGVKTGIVTTLQSTAQNVSAIWTTMKTSATTTWDTIKTTIKNAIDSIKGFLNFDWKWPDIKTPHLSWEEGGVEASGLIKKALEALNLPTSLPKLKVDWYADGGFPNAGSLFVANEAGAELVGSIGGHTAVASNGEITGIRDAILDASAEEMALLRQQNQLLSGILNKEFGISKGELFKSVKSSANEYTRMTGNPAF